MGIVRLRFGGAGKDVGSGVEPRWRGGRGEWWASGVRLDDLSRGWPLRGRGVISTQTGGAQEARRIGCGKVLWSWSSLVLVRRSHSDEAKRAAVAVGAASGIAAGEAAIEILPGLAMGVVGLWRCGCMEQVSCSGDQARATAVGLETEVPDTDEAAREDVQEESLDEVRRFEGEEPAGFAALSIAIAKGHPALFEGHQPFVPDGDAMGVPAQVPEHLRRPGQRRLAIDHPLLGRRLAQQLASKRITQARGACLEGPVEAVEKLASEDPREDTHRHQESRPASDPPVPRGGEATAGHDAVDVGVKGEGLRPGVQDGDRTGQGPQPPPAYVMERLEGGREEKRVAAASLGQEEGMQSRGHCEDEVEVLHREQTARLRLHPPGLFQALALGAVAVPAGVVEGDLTAAVVAHLEMAAQERRPARRDVADHPAAVPPQLLQGRSMGPENLRQLRRAALTGRHRLSRRDLPQGIERAPRLAQIVARHVDVTLRRTQAAMAQQSLDRSHVDPRLE